MKHTDKVSIVSLGALNYQIAAQWLSEPDNNKWLSAVWRDRQIDVRTIAAVCMNKKNSLFLIDSNDRYCGLVALGCINSTDKSGIIWYVLGEKTLRRRGVMTTAVGLLVRKAFSDFNLRSLSASIFEPNHASERLLEKNGFKKVGRMRKAFLLEDRYVDRIIFDLLPADIRDLPNC